MAWDSLKMGDAQLTKNGQLLWIVGPCVLQDMDLTLAIADKVKLLAEHFHCPVIFKASFDKANRSSGSAFRGPGLEKGLRMLETVRQKTGLPITTDVHETHQAIAAGQVVDLIQIPAFLARQTDLVLAAASSGRALNIKKGQFMAPWDMKNVVNKVRSASSAPLLLTERGTSFGYNNLVSDMRSIPLMGALDCPVIFDATHSVQMPGGAGDRTGGDRRMVPVLARAAVAAGCAGLFVETHPRPDESPSDGPNMVPLERLEELMRCCCKFRETYLSDPGPDLA